MTPSSSMKSNSKKSKKKAFRPLIRPPKHPSRKQARRLTTEFHRLTSLRDAAERSHDDAGVAHYDEMIRKMGGREEYQRASQTSTAFFSTTKWVLGYLSRNGWIHGISLDNLEDEKKQSPDRIKQTAAKKRRRPTRTMEVGAINTELLDASNNRHNNLDVRAIDINSMDPRIEENDFLMIPVPETLYDVIVCSMVLNCVTTPEKRGQMLLRLSRFVLPGGLVFLTIPRTCLNLSPYIDETMFTQMLGYCDLQVIETKESPKIAFFICQKTDNKPSTKPKRVPTKWAVVQRIREGKKYRNRFSIVLPDNSPETEKEPNIFQQVPASRRTTTHKISSA